MVNKRNKRQETSNKRKEIKIEKRSQKVPPETAQKVDFRRDMFQEIVKQLRQKIRF